jgi:hypothetical protein
MKTLIFKEELEKNNIIPLSQKDYERLQNEMKSLLSRFDESAHDDTGFYEDMRYVPYDVFSNNLETVYLGDGHYKRRKIPAKKGYVW